MLASVEYGPQCCCCFVASWPSFRVCRWLAWPRQRAKAAAEFTHEWRLFIIVLVGAPRSPRVAHSLKSPAFMLPTAPIRRQPSLIRFLRPPHTPFLSCCSCSTRRATQTQGHTDDTAFQSPLCPRRAPLPMQQTTVVVLSTPGKDRQDICCLGNARETSLPRQPGSAAQGRALRGVARREQGRTISFAIAK